MSRKHTAGIPSGFDPILDAWDDWLGPLTILETILGGAVLLVWWLSTHITLTHDQMVIVLLLAILWKPSGCKCKGVK